jgi:hypothetical protein
LLSLASTAVAADAGPPSSGAGYLVRAEEWAQGFVVTMAVVAVLMAVKLNGYCSVKILSHAVAFN